MDSKNKKILEALQMQPLSDEEKASRHILARLYGPIATTKEKTRNGRGYNRELWEKALADDVFKEKLATKSLFLELGHPADREETDMKMVCACIPEMPKIVDGDLYAYVDILDTPNGKLLKTLCDYGFIPGISSRGCGDIMANDEVDPDTFFLETWDIVALPAVKKARLAMCESFDGKKPLKAILQESYDAANDKDKEVMKEALENLDIKLEESVTEEIEYEDPEIADDIIIEEAPAIEEIPVTPEEVIEDSSDDSEDEIVEEKPAEFTAEEVKEVAEEIKDVVEATPEEAAKIDEVVEEKVEEKAILPEETPVDNIEVSSVVEPVLEEEVKTEAATNSGDEELLESFKEMVRQKDLLEEEVKELRSQKTVSDAEVKRLNEELNKYKAGFIRVSELASKVTETEKANKALTESVASKDAQIKELNEKVEKHTKLTESIDKNAEKVTQLTEKLETVIKESEESEKKLVEQITDYRKKLATRTETAKQYKAKYEQVVEGYIANKASLLNVRTQDITSRLGESYTLADIDKVCDDLLDEPLGFSSLPFSVSRGRAEIQINESVESKKSSDEGYEIDDSLLELAGLK